jgi:ATP-binding cassette, subfamily F, member 3
VFVLQQIALEFGSRVLFEDISWHIKPNEKIGLIGANGTGKSTLLRVISGEYSPSRGDISKRNDLIIGFLNQDLLSYLSDNSILDVAMEAFERANKVHTEIEKILEQLEHDHSEEILNKLHKLQTEYESLDGYQLQSKAEAILEGLGFTTEDLKRPLKEFSGGWRMRVMLAKTLLQKPTLLLLDEPTNHLDLPSIQWLENYLHDYEGAVIIVSHDRYFLDKIVNKIAELEYEKLTIYTGNYSDYLIEKEERKELQMNAFKNQERYIKEQERFIERFRAKASKATAVQSRVKALEKLEKVDEVAGPLAAIKIRFAVDKQPGKIISKLNIRSKAYGDNVLLKNTTAEITRGDKIAFIGANGKGKSTLLRLLSGQEDFDGDREETYNVVETFYAQHQLESLNKENHPLEELQVTAPDETDTYLRSLLGAFLFKGDDVFKKIKVLSGGERARVALAKVILDKANFLLLDEPTNHLDIQSVNVLVEVLNKYEGTYIVVSHDRYFLSRIANKIWFIENKELKEYPGTYHEFEIWQAEQKALKSISDAPVKKLAKAEKAEKATKIYPDNKNNEQAKKKEKQRLETLSKKHEEQVSLLKKEHESLSTQMSDPAVFQDKEKYKKLQLEFEKCVQELKHHEIEWEAYYLKLLELDE